MQILSYHLIFTDSKLSWSGCEIIRYMYRHIGRSYHSAFFLFPKCIWKRKDKGIQPHWWWNCEYKSGKSSSINHIIILMLRGCTIAWFHLGQRWTNGWGWSYHWGESRQTWLNEVGIICSPSLPTHASDQEPKLVTKGLCTFTENELHVFECRAFFLPKRPTLRIVIYITYFNYFFLLIYKIVVMLLHSKLSYQSSFHENSKLKHKNRRVYSSYHLDIPQC